MVRTWIEPIFDRDYGDIREVQSDPNLVNPKGCWNAVDLNRIEKNTAYCVEYMLEKQIYRSDPKLEIRENDNWTGDAVPTYTDIYRIINNVRQITEYARENNANIQEELPVIYASTHIDYVLANQIERALDILHDQPDPPKDYFKLTLEDGIILRVKRYTGEVEEVNSSEVLLAEDEVAVIKGVPSEPDAQYKVFQFWSGNEDDLQYLKNYKDRETEYLGQYRNVSFKANFQTKIPRTLTLTDAFISVTGNPEATSGPTSGTYFAGDRLMIIADKPPMTKVFYEWEGTEEAIRNMVGTDAERHPSTTWLQMPDCNVELNAHFIYANEHKVNVIGGNGTGWYAYKELVSISANVPSHYGFDNWSGPTNYLTDITQSYQSFNMPDIAGELTFEAHWSYRYSYNDVQIIDGKISYNDQEVDKVSGARQTSNLALIPTPPDNSQGILNWTIEGQGRISTDSLGNHTNIFTVGDGNAIITGHYAPIRTITISNQNNTGGTSTNQLVQGRKQRFTTSSTVGEYRFNGWYENNTRISTSTTLDVTSGASDRTIEARYDFYPTYTVTLVNRNNSSQTTTSRVLSGNNWSSSTNEEVGDYLLVGWNKDGSQVSTSTRYSFTVSKDTTIEVVYRPKETYHLTVNNGTGSGDYKERQSVNITADDGDFSDWSTSNIYDIGSRYSKSTWVKLGRGNGEVTANYNLRQITVVTHSGTHTYSVRQGARLDINALPAPDTYEWDTNTGWTIDEGGTGSFGNPSRSDTYFVAGSTDATIRAHYSPIPWFNVTVQSGGYIINSDGSQVTTGRYMRNTPVRIQQYNADEAFTFSQWEVLSGRPENVESPLAGTTNIINLTNDVVVQGLFYIPDENLKFTLTVIRTDGTIQEYKKPVGESQDVKASMPPEGMKFYRWERDYQYLTRGRYEADNKVKFPAKDITIEEHFEPLNWTPTYHLHMTTLSECMYETSQVNPDTGETTTTEVWDTEHEYVEGTKVQIRLKPFDDAWMEFVRWEAVDEDNNVCSQYILETSEPTTFVEMPDKDLWITPITKRKDGYLMTIIDGQITGQEYFEGASADIYFEKITEESKRGEVKYKFKRWITGPDSEIGVQDLKIYETGKQFDVLVAGTQAEPQFIAMPNKNVVIQATYDTLYQLDLTNGTIDDLGEKEPYYLTGTKVNITANEAPENKKFIRWVGDTECVENEYDPTTKVTIPAYGVKLTAKYALETDKNDFGIVLNDLTESDTINKTDINIISGKIQNGMIITDTKGHNYIARISLETIPDVITITRMTKIYKGGDLYE